MMWVIDINVIHVQKQLQYLHGVLLSHFCADFPWSRVVANKKATEPRVPGG